LFGTEQVQATPECLACALAASGLQREEVNAALKYLEQSSIIVFRRHRGAYGLWEGSDIDLESLFNQVRRPPGATAEVLSTIRERARLHPIPARGHFFRTGTLRFFEVDVVMLADLPTATTTMPP
jgi:hypothetical protein